MLERTRSPISPNSAVVAGAKSHHRAELSRTRTDSLEPRTRRNSPRDSATLKDMAPTSAAEPFFNDDVPLPQKLDSLFRSRSSLDGLKVDDVPRLSPKESDIPGFKQSLALTSMEMEAVNPETKPRTKPPLRYMGSTSFESLAGLAGTPRPPARPPDSNDEMLETASSATHLMEGNTGPDDLRSSEQEADGGVWERVRDCWQSCIRATEDPTIVCWVALKCIVVVLFVVLVAGACGCSPHWFPHWVPSHDGSPDSNCVPSSSQQCNVESLPLQLNATEIDPFIAQIEKKLEHVRKLRTDMAYLRRSTLDEERHAGEHIDQFKHQQREIKRAEKVIAVIQRRLYELGVVKRSTTLSCDWMDETKTPFRACSSRERPFDSSNSCHSARGCHVPVQQSGDFELLESLLKQDRDLSQATINDSTLLSSDSESSTTFDCFDSEGLAQGCHAHAMQRLAQARFRVGCARRWQPQLWGWCGKWPWSHFWASPVSLLQSDSRSGIQEETRGPDVGSAWDDPVEAYHGCTTLLDVFHWVYDKMVSYSIWVGSLLSGWYYISRSFASLTTGVNQAKAGVSELQARASGLHNKAFVNRVSLSLNLLLPSSTREDDDVQNQKQKHKLLPRTLWERDLHEIMSDPDQRANFRAAANATTAKEPFLRDSQEGSEREERKLVINLFSNHISSICSTNFILQDLGEAVQDEAFVFGLTFEEAWTATEATGTDGAAQSSATPTSIGKGNAADESPVSPSEDSAPARALAKQKKEDLNHVKKIRVLMMREKMLRELLTKTEDDIEFQSQSGYHKMRLKHLQLMAKKWDTMGRQANLAKQQKRVEPQYDYIGKVRLCVPVSSQAYGGNGGQHRPRTESSSQAEPVGDPYDVTTPPDAASESGDGTPPAEPKPARDPPILQTNNHH